MVLSTVFFWLLFCFFSALSYELLPYGFLKLGLVASLSAGSFSFLIRPCLKPLKARWQKKLNWISLMIALLTLVDVFFILSKQGWNTDHGMPYFRPPFNHDLERHLILINALLRKTDSPFLPHSAFAYQILWHHGIATLIAPFQTHLNYEGFRGFLLATAILFYWVLCWSIGLRRPSMSLRIGGVCLLFLVLFIHADLFSFILSLVYHRVPGIEADWSFRGPLIFRMGSPKILALTSPQHNFFLMILSLFLNRRFLFSGKRIKILMEGLLFALLFVSSPPLAVIFLGPWYLYEAYQKRAVPFRVVLFGSLVPVLYDWVYGYSMFRSFNRPAIMTLQWFPDWIGHWVSLPLLWVGILGVPGLVLTLLLSKKMLKSVDFYLLFLGGATFFCYNIVTDMELRRHVSMLAAVLFLFYLAKHWFELKKTFLERFTPLASGAVLSLGLLLHGYFLYCLVGKKSYLSSQVAWQDYLVIRDKLRTNYAGVPTLAAIDPDGLGLSFTPVLEATTSFATPLDASVHGLLSTEQRERLARIAFGESVLKHARELGYELIVWGPVEEKVWGPTEKREDWQKLESSGSVNLFRLAPLNLPMKLG